MNVANLHRRRTVDRYPLTQRIGWAFWRAVIRLERAAPSIVGFCAVGVFWASLFLVLFYGWSR